eukprot:TRINITY_DN43_c1_g1_i3.p1 TRINITY_DN43_c1_g1~~TRINITY_DN43_c1_g1_i3.p1  ORF type:complete len:335 (+),score=77.59 TRINITY_DN43_c1_g1_i3:20-1024(+)
MSRVHAHSELEPSARALLAEQQQQSPPHTPNGRTPRPSTPQQTPRTPTPTPSKKRARHVTPQKALADQLLCCKARRSSLSPSPSPQRTQQPEAETEAPSPLAEERRREAEEEEALLDRCCAAAPCDTMLALQMLCGQDFPPRPAAGRRRSSTGADAPEMPQGHTLPKFALKTQLYGCTTDRTKTDTELELLVNTGEVRMFKLLSRQGDEAIMLHDDYAAHVHHCIDVFAARAQQQQPGAPERSTLPFGGACTPRVFDLFETLVVPQYRQCNISQEMLRGLLSGKNAAVTDTDITYTRLHCVSVLLVSDYWCRQVCWYSEKLAAFGSTFPTLAQC